METVGRSTKSKKRGRNEKRGRKCCREKYSCVEETGIQTEVERGGKDGEKLGE